MMVASRRLLVHTTLLAYVLLSLGHVEDLVLCIAGDGQVVIKFASAACCEDTSTDASSNASRVPEPNMPAGSCAACVDIPLPASRADAHTARRVTERGPLSHVCMAACAETRSAILPLSPLPASCPPESLPSLAALHTVVLLL